MKNDLFKLLSPSDDTDIRMLAEESLSRTRICRKE